MLSRPARGGFVVAVARGPGLLTTELVEKARAGRRLGHTGTGDAKRTKQRDQGGRPRHPRPTTRTAPGPGKRGGRHGASARDGALPGEHQGPGTGQKNPNVVPVPAAGIVCDPGTPVRFKATVATTVNVLMFCDLIA